MTTQTNTDQTQKNESNQINFTHMNQDKLNSIIKAAGINGTDETIRLLVSMHPGQAATVMMVDSGANVVSMESTNDILDVIEHLSYELIGVAVNACHSRIKRCYLANVEKNKDSAFVKFYDTKDKT